MDVVYFLSLFSIILGFLLDSVLNSICILYILKIDFSEKMIFLIVWILWVLFKIILGNIVFKCFGCLVLFKFLLIVCLVIFGNKYLIIFIISVVLVFWNLFNNDNLYIWWLYLIMWGNLDIVVILCFLIILSVVCIFDV